MSVTSTKVWCKRQADRELYRSNWCMNKSSVEMVKQRSTSAGAIGDDIRPETYKTLGSPV